MKPRAIVSVTDKQGVVEFARGLEELGFEVVSTGGTAKALRDAGVAVRDVADVTGFPEMMDGRVKTLHPLVHGGLLGDVRLESHRAAMEAAGIQPVTILAVNLYAFEKTVTGPHDMEQAIESIDIGGPAMIRAAAKNWANVAVVVDPSDYPAVLQAAKEGTLSELRLGLCAKAFRHTAFYDSMISRYLTKAAGKGGAPETLTVGTRLSSLPVEDGALYVDPFGASGIAEARLVAGPAPTVRVLRDADRAWRLACAAPVGTCTVVMDGVPVGGVDRLVAAAKDGAVVACGGVVTKELAAAMTGATAVVAERFEPEAAGILSGVSLLEAPRGMPKQGPMAETVGGGWLVVDQS